MEHPLIASLDALTIDELGTKISELHKKLGIAMRMGNGYLCDQIRMALESYQSKYQQRLQESYKSNDSDKTFDDKIDIS
ncbi:hypothetical protein UFOVP1146_228 [uncultured Caudovirales phage]|jgi:hypothetical protein|uniref:Uncharacterized protein n=1 Tax=uncultured Caudovirales phage TaxID=2100421 RepID=A0A6J5QST6_9CAUD|nr:hypothetical protein UFOVP812_141 [uncultured Caudovirales phage]CAB4165110.1 hypothetical protein UFOVP818_2 [uncultured Caudovirales phage]CAB4186882.1 hypothetical protein UFOVP1146_228 [uncultured Caudovirales phage]CAB4221471.1 hypothetical protein UFOVP1638_337 [uncultured Caudovirales phage]